MDEKALWPLFWIAFLGFIVIIAGEPDILDGWIKRANQTECTSQGKTEVTK